MKRGLSTGKPTKREAERIVACKEGRCMACIQNEAIGLACDGDGCDYHHLKSGNIRKGHRHGIALCAWHHRGVPLDGYNRPSMELIFGPSLANGSRRFHDNFGTDSELLELQDALIGWKDE